MKLVILESPYAGDIAVNVAYARACVRDSLSRGEAPIASHLLYTQPGVLRDEVAEERQWGIDAGLAWRHVSAGSVVYTDLGMSRGMEYGVALAKESGKTVEFRSLPEWADGRRPVEARRRMDFATALAQLRHLYVQMRKGAVTKPEMAADGLLSPVISSLERIQAETRQF